MRGQDRCSQSASSPCPGASQAAGLTLEELCMCAVTWQSGSTAVALLVLLVCPAAYKLHTDLPCWEHGLNAETEVCELVGSH